MCSHVTDFIARIKSLTAKLLLFSRVFGIINIVYFPFLDGDAPRRPSYGVYIS